MRQPIAAFFFVIFALSMIVVVLHLLPVGDPHLPGYADFVSPQMAAREIPRQADSVALHYNRQAAIDVGSSSVVCATILDYRGYDTLYETTVLFTAAIAVLALIGKEEEEEDNA